MDVHLLVYDLSQGLARQMSMGILGFQLDAIYHTSIELHGTEYVYDGGIVAIKPGSSHLGQPMDRIRLGSTSLPMDVITEYLDSLRPIFTAEAYDLLSHNCNNFSDSFSNFLVGRGIPDYITNMPKAVLDSPMGQMLLPQVMQGMAASRRQNGSLLGLQASAQAPSSQTSQASPLKYAVKNISTATDFDRLLDEAKKSCAVVFFTSATCPPCKMLYPIYNELAHELGDRVTFIKVDISQPQAHIIARKYSVRATPTFVTFLRGGKENEWTGADQVQLQGNVRLLAEMAHTNHPHERLHLPTFSNPNTKPVLFEKVPPLDKLLTKMGDDMSKKPEVQTVKYYVEERAKSRLDSAIIPDAGHLATLVQDSVKSMPPDTLFSVVDLLRYCLSDPRISGVFATETEHKTVQSVLHSVNKNTSCPYPLRLVTLQMACNLFSTPLYSEELFKHSDLRAAIVSLISSSFLDETHTTVRVAAASLLFNVSLANQHARRQGADQALPVEDQVELAASLIEAISQEETSAGGLKGMLSALGHLVYCAPLDGELVDLLRVLDADGTVLSKRKAFPDEQLITEVGLELLGKGLRRP